MDNLYKLKTTKQIAKDIATRVRKKRKFRKIAQEEMARRVGISLSKYRRFEKNGEIDLLSLIDIANVIGEGGKFDELFVTKDYRNIEEVIRENA